jgi:hypothetical protein
VIVGVSCRPDIPPIAKNCGLTVQCAGFVNQLPDCGILDQESTPRLCDAQAPVVVDEAKVDLPRFSGEALAHLPACFRIELGW